MCEHHATKLTISICSKRMQIKWIIRNVYMYCSKQNIFIWWIEMIHCYSESKTRYRHSLDTWNLFWQQNLCDYVDIMFTNIKKSKYKYVFTNKMKKMNHNKYIMWNKQGIQIRYCKKIFKPTRIWIENTQYIDWYLLLLLCNVNSYNTKYLFFKLKNS